MTFNAMTEHYEEITVCGKCSCFNLPFLHPFL